jgi:hypothetical protein
MPSSCTLARLPRTDNRCVAGQTLRRGETMLAPESAAPSRTGRATPGVVFVDTLAKEWFSPAVAVSDAFLARSFLGKERGREGAGGSHED